MTDYDSPWKEALDHFFELFLAFFFPEVHAAIDWTRDYESLDKELHQIAPEGELGRREADKLVKVWGRENGGDAAYLHIEIQSQDQGHFERRVYVYNYRLEDRFNQPVVSLAVLGDDYPRWRPSEYVFEKWGCRKTFHFPAVKLLDYAGRETELEAHPNPFALMVLAHLKAQETRQDAEGRRAWKVRLVKGLYDRQLDGADLRQWYRLLDWLLPLPQEQKLRFWQEVTDYEKEKGMPFVTTGEEIGFERGHKQGLDEGLREGLREGLLRALELGLKLRFGAEGVTLMADLRPLKDVAKLEVIREGLEKVNTLDELRLLIP